MKLARTMLWGLPIMGLFCAIVLGGCDTFPTLSATRTVQKSESTATESDALKFLQRQIKERDRRIEELSSQLEALKAIDQDTANRRKPALAPATTIPIE